MNKKKKILCILIPVLVILIAGGTVFALYTLKQNNIREARLTAANADVMYENLKEEENPDYSHVLEKYEEAARFGNGDALYHLGLMYYYGQGVEQDYTKALEYYEKANTAGFADACYEKANMLLTGTGVEADLTAGVELLITGADLGSAQAAGELGNIYKNGSYGQTADTTLAFNYWLKAADLGAGPSYSRGVGLCYLSGDGCNQDTALAVKYLDAAAGCGDANALYTLAKIYWSSDYGVQDLTTAASYADRLSEIAPSDACSAYNNISLAASENGDTQGAYDYIMKAVSCITDAGAAGNLPDAESLANIYHNAAVGAYNLGKTEEALSCCKLASLNGDSDIILTLGGNSFAAGDYQTALSFFELAMTEIDLTAHPDYNIYNLSGYCAYQLGDYALAREYMEKSIELNETDAEAARTNLQIMGLNGL